MMPPATNSRFTVLIVDDDPIARLLTSSFLQKSGHRIILAENGSEAIELFEEQSPDLILMDVSMPVMTGYEAAAVIKQKSLKHFIPIIFLTSYDDDESLTKCVESGGDMFLTKPVNRVLLAAKIKAMQRIIDLQRELEHYKMQTEEEIELAQHVFDSLTRRMTCQNIPELEYWQLAAGHFSGDLLIYNKSPKGTLYAMLGDFTGHGFSAAIGALPTSDIFFAMTGRDFSAEVILAEINRKLLEIMPATHFCATGFICFDQQANHIEIFNAGLPPILIFDSEGQVETKIESTNIALGIISSDELCSEIVRIDNFQNRTVVVYSDGLTEAQNAAGNMFGNERLLSTLSCCYPSLTSIRTALTDFIANQALKDDISLLTLRT